MTVVFVSNPNSLVERLAFTSIRVGNDPHPGNNVECVGSIDRDGVYECPTPLKGNYVGFVRTGSSLKYGVREIWAFVWHTLKEPDFILSSDVMPNLTLANSLFILSSPVNGEGMRIDNLFITGPAINCYWLMNLKKNMHVKALLVIGDFPNGGNSRLSDWKVTVGNNPYPL